MPKGKKAAKGTKAKVQPVGRDGEGKPTERVHMLPVICPRCRSPRRSPFIRRETVLDFENVMTEPKLGVHYDRIIYRDCKCLDCGQRMRVREFTMKPPQKPASGKMKRHNP